jgi:ATP adenylyltransferase
MKAGKEESRCVFCDAAASNRDEENLVVFRAQHNLVLLNRYPYTSGHVMIAPYAHVPRLNDVAEETLTEVAKLTRRIEAILEAAYKPEGINLGMNLGRAAGAGIADHIHMHMLPRWSGDANFMTSVASTRIIPESLDETYRKIKQGFEMPAQP